MLLIPFCFVLSAFAAACTQDPNTKDCTSCETVNTIEICAQCKTNGHVPIDGVCVSDAEAANKCKKAGGDALDGTTNVCGECSGDYFFHKSGCYSTDEGKPGRTLCAVARDGICVQGADGYFAVSGAAKTGESVVACNDDTTGVIVGGNTYKGVKDCATCRPPDSPAAREDKVAICESCSEGFYGTNLGKAGGTCTACTDGVNCAKCDAGEGKCTRCKASAENKYFKKNEGDDETGICVNTEDCNTGNNYFTDDSDDPTHGKMCKKCSEGIIDCKTCDLKEKSKDSILITCSSCTTDTNKPNIDGTKCIACAVKDCKRCNDDGTCAECDGGRRLSPLRDVCLENCPAGTYPENNDSISVCVLCHSSCVSCENSNAETSCTACYPGSVLNRTSGDAGRCIPECTGEFMAHCAAGQCDGVIGGSKYYKKCDNGYVPINGICTAVGAAGRDASMCTAGDGVCTACKTDYALLSGGCYNTNKVPGNLVCETADGTGKCTRCTANSANPNGQPCPTCSDGCAKCNDSSACTECLPGYYKGTSQCFKCTANSDNGIEGVENCISCAVPISNSGPVTCYVKKDGTSGDSGSGGNSTNKSGLSAGAIAAIVVVGGLVGFLCWWFICRGKA